jgi:uncharacterized RDD family membrane protein YckC
MTEAPPPPPQEPDGSAGGATPPPSDPTYGAPAQPSQPSYGQPTPPAYGEPAAPPPAYGQQPPAYGQQPPAYGQPPAAYGAPAGVPQGVQLAPWGMRAYGALIDFVGPVVIAYIFLLISRPLGWIFYVAALAWSLFQAYQGGATGQSMGKKIAGTRLAREADGQNIGGGMGVGRYFVHILDSLACYLGWLWPLWDTKRQTFADKILKTVVVKV